MFCTDFRGSTDGLCNLNGNSNAIESVEGDISPDIQVCYAS